MTARLALAEILAADDEVAVFNGTCGAESGWVPVSASSPSLLVGTIEVELQAKGQDKPPLLPNPVTGAGSGTGTGSRPGSGTGSGTGAATGSGPGAVSGADAGAKKEPPVDTDKQGAKH